MKLINLFSCQNRLLKCGGLFSVAHNLALFAECVVLVFSLMGHGDVSLRGHPDPDSIVPLIHLVLHVRHVIVRESPLHILSRVHFVLLGRQVVYEAVVARVRGVISRDVILTVAAIANNRADH